MPMLRWRAYPRRADGPRLTLADLLTTGKPRRLAVALGVALPLALLTLLGGCSSGQSTDFQSLSSRGYGPRPQPAELTAATADELTAQGYEQIGIVQVRQRVRRCQDERCRDLPHDQDATAVARELAAQKGGDLLILSKDNELEQSERDVPGRCKDSLLASSMGHRLGIGVTDDCVQWETVHEVAEYRVSAGSVWRKRAEGR